jgi:hypothetical protein
LLGVSLSGGDFVGEFGVLAAIVRKL